MWGRETEVDILPLTFSTQPFLTAVIINGHYIAGKWQGQDSNSKSLIFLCLES